MKKITITALLFISSMAALNAKEIYLKNTSGEQIMWSCTYPGSQYFSRVLNYPGIEALKHNGNLPNSIKIFYVNSAIEVDGTDQLKNILQIRQDGILEVRTKYNQIKVISYPARPAASTPALPKKTGWNQASSLEEASSSSEDDWTYVDRN